MSLIEREKAIRAVAADLMANAILKSADVSDNIQDWIPMAEDILSIVPTVDAAPIRRGEWVDVHFRTVPYDRITGAKKCPYCGKKKDKYVQWNWCPNCGAKLMNNKVSTTIGEWVDDGDPLTLVCGVCGYRVMRYNNTKFCPDCGALMNGKDGDHHAYNH